MSFNKLHSKCDGSHEHEQSAGKETRVTQLYTDEIVKIILKSVKNEILLDRAYGIPTRKDSAYNNTSKALSCVVLQGQLKDVHQSTCQDEATLRSLLGEALRWKVKVRLTLRRLCPDPGPETSCAIPLEAMATAATSSSTATTDGRGPGPQACRTTVAILGAVTDGGFGNQIPARFTTWQEEGGPCTDKTVTRWIENVQVPTIFVVSLAFI